MNIAVIFVPVTFRNPIKNTYIIKNYSTRAQDVRPSNFDLMLISRDTTSAWPINSDAGAHAERMEASSPISYDGGCVIDDLDGASGSVASFARSRYAPSFGGRSGGS